MYIFIKSLQLMWISHWLTQQKSPLSSSSIHKPGDNRKWNKASLQEVHACAAHMHKHKGTQFVFTRKERKDSGSLLVTSFILLYTNILSQSWLVICVEIYFFLFYVYIFIYLCVLMFHLSDMQAMPTEARRGYQIPSNRWLVAAMWGLWIESLSTAREVRYLNH